MKISTKDTIEAPIEFVFARVTDFASFERLALRRGLSVRRVDRLPNPGVGSVWDLKFPFRGKEREARLEIAGITAPESASFMAKSGGIDSITAVELVALSKTQTRLTITVELKPTNLTSRLLVQSFKLAKGSIVARLQARASAFCADIQDRYQSKEKA
jgi:hypothetical protein